MDTGGEVTIVAESDGTTDPDEPTGPERFRKLPERIRLEDTIATQKPDPPPDPTMGRDPDRDFLLRNADG
jgi:hypothetical protein